MHLKLVNSNTPSSSGPPSGQQLHFKKPAKNPHLTFEFIQIRKLMYAKKIFWFRRPRVRLSLHSFLLYIPNQLENACMHGSASYPDPSAPRFCHKWLMRSSSWRFMYRKAQIRATAERNRRSYDAEMGEMEVRKHMLWMLENVECKDRAGAVTGFISGLCTGPCVQVVRTCQARWLEKAECAVSSTLSPPGSTVAFRSWCVQRVTPKKLHED